MGLFSKYIPEDFNYSELFIDQWGKKSWVRNEYGWIWCISSAALSKISRYAKWILIVKKVKRNSRRVNVNWGRGMPLSDFVFSNFNEATLKILLEYFYMSPNLRVDVPEYLLWSRKSNQANTRGSSGAQRKYDFPISFLGWVPFHR